MLIKVPDKHPIIKMIINKECYNSNLEKCSICFSDLYTAIRLNCGHRFCKVCIIKWINVTLDDGKFTIPCLQASCKKIILPKDIPYKHLSSRIDERLLQYALIKMRDSIICNSCNKILGFGRNRIFNCPPCKYQCEDCKNNVIERKNWELLTYFYKLNCKKCPKCKIIIDKDNGCSHMTCRCGYDFCWYCLKRWDDTHVCSRKKSCFDF